MKTHKGMVGAGGKVAASMGMAAPPPPASKPPKKKPKRRGTPDVGALKAFGGY